MRDEKKLLIEMQVNSLRESRNFAKLAVKYFKSGDTILLYGNLGSGKTFLVRLFTFLLGSHSEVSSPSFSLINQYNGDLCINHIDLYRIQNETELINLGLEDLWQKHQINFIEWPELIEKLINWRHMRIYIETDPQKYKWRKFSLFEFYE
jgi:tRNA threonylcarbamoyladenosine biosynthesis protein TsaE